MRKFGLVVLDASDEIIDRFAFDNVTDISGLGYTINLSTIDTDVESFVTRIYQKKKNLKLTVAHENGYIAGDALDSFYQIHITDTVCLEYDNGHALRYAEVKIVESAKTELDFWGELSNELSFQPLTPFFELTAKQVVIRTSSYGHAYPYTYPFRYGTNVVENNEFENPYMKEVPLTIEITGAVSAPILKLRSEDGSDYEDLRFDSTAIVASGEKLIINSAKRKIWLKASDGILTDWYSHITGGYDSYLRLAAGDRSKLIFTYTGQFTGTLTGRYRKYGL